MQEESIVCWNYCGTISREFSREISELQRNYRQKLIILLDLRISDEGADEVCRKLVKTHWIWSKAMNFSRGIWLLWDDVDLQVKLIHIHRSFVHVGLSQRMISVRC